jgi:hypothetical protein
MIVLSFSTTFVWNISHSKKNSATYDKKCNNVLIYLFTTIGLLPRGSGYFTCKQNMKLVTAKFKSGGLHEKRVVATWNVGNRLCVCL